MSENKGIFQVPVVGKNSENISSNPQKLVYVHIPKDKDASLPTTFTLTKTTKLSSGNSITFSSKPTVLNSSTSKVRPPILGNKVTISPSLPKSAPVPHVPITTSKPIKVLNSNRSFGSNTTTIFRTSTSVSSSNVNILTQGSGSSQAVSSVCSPAQIQNSPIISQVQSKSPKPVLLQSKTLSGQNITSTKLVSQKILPMPIPAKQGVKNSTVLSYGSVLSSGANSASDSPSPAGIKRDSFGTPKSAFTPPPLILQSGSNAKKLGTKTSGPTTISILTGKSSNSSSGFSLYPLSRSTKPSSMMNFKISNGQIETGNGGGNPLERVMTQTNPVEEDSSASRTQDIIKKFKTSTGKPIEQKDILQEAMTAMVSDTIEESSSFSFQAVGAKSLNKSSVVPITVSVTQVPDTVPVAGLSSNLSKPQSLPGSIPILLPKNVTSGCATPILLQGTLPVLTSSSVPVTVHKVKVHPSSGNGTSVLQPSTDLPGLFIRTDAVTVRRKIPGKDDERKEPTKPDLSIIPILRNSSQDKSNITVPKSPRMNINPEQPMPGNGKASMEVFEEEDKTKKSDSMETTCIAAEEEQNVKAEVKELLNWENGTGSLVGSDLKFTVNEFNVVELVEDNALDEIKSQISSLVKKEEAVSSYSEYVVPQQSDAVTESVLKPTIPVHIHHARKPNLNRKEEDIVDSDINADPGSKTAKNLYDICCCKNCGCYGLSSEFYKANGNSFCTVACSEDYLTKEAEWNREKQRLEKSKSRLKKTKSEMKDSVEKVEVKSKEVKEISLKEHKDVKEENEPEIKEPSPAPLPDVPPPLEQPKEGTISDVPKFQHSWQDTKSHAFSWVKYLEHCTKSKEGVASAPLRLWNEPFPFGKNLFKTGMKLEGIDPQHQSLFCVMTVADVVGHRIRLHFDGFSDMYDFWCNANSPHIFQVGWCEKNGKTLETPPGIFNFTWRAYLEHCGAVAAPKHAFTTSISSPSGPPSNFRVGMKLEAEDRKNGWICVATVADVMENKVLVHFDGWDKAFDTWFDITSPYIHPIGWCSKNDVYLYPPKDYANPDSFLWHEYLQETNSMGVPARAFKVRSSKEFKPEMKLEAVDKRNPMLIRVATVSEVKPFKLLLHFDGWPDMYDFWVDDDSQDIHPPTWCNKTGHQLQPPLTPEQCAEDVDSGVGCGTQGCKGYGHVKGLIYNTHHTAYGCPYSLQNLNKDWEALLPDRLEVPKEKKKGKLVKNYINLDASKPIRDESEDSQRKRVRKRRKFFDELTPPEGAKTKMMKTSSDESSSNRTSVPSKGPTPCHSTSISQVPASTSHLVTSSDGATSSKKSIFSATTEEFSVDTIVHQSIFNPGYHPDPPSPLPHTMERFKHITADIKVTRRAEVDNWGPEDVCNAISKIPGCEISSLKFLEQEVDGESFLMMTQKDLVNLLGIKLGPAIKIIAFICSLKRMP